jgi:hypothetical protein
MTKGQTMSLIDHPIGNYRFLSGIAPYSAGVVAQPGYEIVRVTLATPVPYGQGFELIDRLLAEAARPSQALCAVELRLPAPLSFQGFSDFNVGYRTLLAERSILVGEVNPVARTNIAPLVLPPAEPALYAFSYTSPAPPAAPPSFIVAGAGDLRDQAALTPEAVVRPGESSLDALREKVACVMEVMTERLVALGRGWAEATAVDLYTAQNIQPLLAEEILNRIGTAAVHGVHWFYSHPPIADLIFEMDLRGVRREVRM